MCRRAKVMGRRLTIAVCALMLYLSAACARISESQLIGRWRAEYEIGYQVLTLNKDGTFKQEITLREGSGPARIVSNQGTWKYLTSDWPYLQLDNCLVPFEMDGTVKRQIDKPYGSCRWPIERDWLVGTRLRIGSVEGNPFRKLEQP